MPFSMKLCVLVLVSLTLATPLRAQNLLGNSEFDDAQGLGSWFTNATGTWTLDADAGSCTQSNAALGTSGGPPGDQFLNMYSEQCIAIDPTATPTLHLGATYRTTAQVWARLHLQYFTDADCANHLAFSSPVFAGTSPEWTTMLGEFAVPGGAGSVRVLAEFNPQVTGLAQYTGAFDRIYLGASAQIFADPFEADGGSACRWSTTQAFLP